MISVVFGDTMTLTEHKHESQMNEKERVEQRIYVAIVDAILNKQLTSGTRLVEAPLCKAFGVTRGVLRRVFVKLAHDKVIEIQPNRGAVVAQYSAKETEDVFEARLILELANVKKLAQKKKSVDLSGLKKIVQEERDSIANGHWKEWINLSGKFHIKLSELNPNSIVTGYLQTLIARTSLLIGLYTVPHHNTCSIEEHTDIINAIEAGDEARAMSLMQHHLEDYSETFLKEKDQESDIDLYQLFHHSA